MRLPNPPSSGNADDILLYLNRVIGLLDYEGPVECLFGWVSHEKQTVQLGVLPYHSYVYNVSIHCTEAFDSDGTDNISVGWATDNIALATATSVATTGVKTVTMGTNEGYNSSTQDIFAYYVNGGSEPTTGKAVVLVWFVRVKEEI